MKFVTFQHGSFIRLGVLERGAFYDLTSLDGVVRSLTSTVLSSRAMQTLAACSPVTFRDMLSFLRVWGALGPSLLELTREMMDALQQDRIPAEFQGAPLQFSEREIKLLSPLPRPSSLRDGYAFRQHVETMRRNRGMEMVPEFDHFPVFYFGNHQSVVGPGDFYVQPWHLDQLDYELEAAIVIGREGMNISADQADSYIFGFVIMNDMSARALQREEMKLSLGPAKGKDFGTVLGPAIVTPDELADRTQATPQGNRYQLAMKAEVNGAVLSQGNLDSMNWTFAQIIERASYGVMLYPGDVIGSGTVGTGCLAELNSSKITDNLWLRPGDRVRLEIDRLGVLENTIMLRGEA